MSAAAADDPNEPHRDEIASQINLRLLESLRNEKLRLDVLSGQLLQAQKMEAIGSLAGGVAHDFNNLLMGIIGLADALQAALPVGDPRHADAKGILELAERGSSITKKLLQISRKRDANPQATDLGALAAGMADVLRRLLNEDIEFTVDAGNKPVPVRVDRASIEQVMLNLVVNARDAMPRGGRIRVIVSRDDTGPIPVGVLSVTDNGCGIPASLRERIFEPYFTTKGGGGTGIGLSVVYSLVQQADGIISVQSEVDRGTTFQITLPLTQETPALTEADPQRQQRHRTILLVDDDDSVRKVIAGGLRRAGNTVTDCVSAEAALLQLEQSSAYDIIVSDLNLTGISGDRLAVILQERGQRIPVLILSGDCDEAALAGLPIAGIVAKPVRTPELVARIEAALAQPRRD